MIVLRSGSLRAVVLPAAGGGLARLDWLGGAAPESVLRPAPDGVAKPLPGQLACFPLVPWSNRIAPDGFEFEGRRITPAPTREGEPCPIHGDGWRMPWHVEARDESSVVLSLYRRDASPFAFTAHMAYTLSDNALRVTLKVTNNGRHPLPFGLGLHPWMPNPEDARLRAVANGVWLSGADKLPAVRSALPPAWDFCTEATRPLPCEGVDNAFTGWDGQAQIDWPERRLRLRISADMGYYILYVPRGKDFFCFEPVDHPVNAHNLPGGAAANGLTVLAPGQDLRRTVRFAVEEIA
ncbi:aldose 1-epimerase [Duganella sp. CF458]|uniref:aldose 1-epimerase n=1 Tax=Duganella sp. CF458 TaxID=1884368 RepID=UPI0008F3684C|nr:aldose 1-epimerase [Duganella sp. CF458]SFF52479.1 aldose 1-epimerase [Duganella sp. CF458]